MLFSFPCPLSRGTNEFIVEKSLRQDENVRYTRLIILIDEVRKMFCHEFLTEGFYRDRISIFDSLSILAIVRVQEKFFIILSVQTNKYHLMR